MAVLYGRTHDVGAYHSLWPDTVVLLAGTFAFCGPRLMYFLRKFYAILPRSQQIGIPAFASAAWGMLYGTVYLGIFSLLMDYDFTIEYTIRYLGSLVYLTFVSTVLTFSCYLLLIGRIGANRAGYATVVFPVFALILSTGFENYQWSVSSIVGLGLVLIGNLVMIRSPQNATVWSE